MKSYKLVYISFVLCFVFSLPSYADQLEDAKAAIQNEDFLKAHELLRPLAEEKNAEAQFLLGSLYVKGQGVEKDDTKGLSWVMKAARQGYTEARSSALSICLDLANQGDAAAMYNVGYMCMKGWGGERDPDVCLGWLENAAKSGHVRSANVLSEIYAKGKFGITPDEEKASFWSDLPEAFAADIDGIWSEEATDQADSPTELTFDSEAQEYVLEDTIVNGSLLSLKWDWYEAEDLKFEIFNSLNSTDDFDIKCEMRPRWGMRIKNRFCEPVYFKKAREQAYQMARGFSGWGIVAAWYPSDFQLALELAPKTEALNKEMVELGGKHPSLAKAMINEYELRQRYISERRERFKDSILIGRTEPEEYFGDELQFMDIAYVAYNDGMMEKYVWNYWDKKFRSVIYQEPYRSLWLSSNTKTYAPEFVAYVNRILSGR
jgi:hypothetical protein